MPDLNIEEAADEIGSDIFGQQEDNTPEEVTEIVTEEQPEAVEAAPEVQDTPPPKSWAKEYHDKWKGLPPEVKEYVQLREKQMLDGLDSYKQHSDIGKAVADIAKPYQEILQREGVDVPQAVSHLFNVHMRLTQGTPEQRLMEYKRLGENLGLLKAGQVQADPSVQAALQMAQEAKQYVTQIQQQQLEAQRASAMQAVDEFSKDKPYFDEVADDIITFINAGLPLQEAYDRAVWANPVTRAKEQQRVAQEAKTAMLNKAKQTGTAARKAASINIRSRDTGRTPTEPLGKMEDTLSSTLKTIRERSL